MSINTKIEPLTPEQRIRAIDCALALKHNNYPALKKLKREGGDPNTYVQATCEKIESECRILMAMTDDDLIRMLNSRYKLSENLGELDVGIDLKLIALISEAEKTYRERYIELLDDVIDLAKKPQKRRNQFLNRIKKAVAPTKRPGRKITWTPDLLITTTQTFDEIKEAAQQLRKDRGEPPLSDEEFSMVLQLHTLMENNERKQKINSNPYRASRKTLANKLAKGRGLLRK